MEDLVTLNIMPSCEGVMQGRILGFYVVRSTDH
jgi:hypothetical protein